MGLTRVLPRTEAQVERLLHALKAKMAVVPSGEMALTALTQAAVTANNTSFDRLIDAKVIALYNQTKSNKLALAAKNVDKMFVSHFFQTFNMGVERGKYDAESRVFFGIAVKDKTVPPLTSEALIFYWGGKIITGDSARVTAGGAAMANPSAAEVGTTNGDYSTKFDNAGNDEETFSSKQADVTATMPDEIRLCTKALDEIETFYSGLSKEAIRTKVRGWGGVYESEEVMTINAHVQDFATGVMLADANIEVIESGTNHTTDAAGNSVIHTTIAFSVTLRVSLDGYVTQDVVVDFTTGVTTYGVAVKLVAL